MSEQSQIPFAPVFQSNSGGVAKFDLSSKTDHAFTLDFDHSYKQDHSTTNGFGVCLCYLSFSVSESTDISIQVLQPQ